MRTAVFLSLAVWALVITCCVVAGSPLRPADWLEKGEDAAALLDAPLVERAAMAVGLDGPTGPTWASAVVHQPPKPAPYIKGGVPAVIAFDSRPIAGRLWQARFVTDYVGPRYDRVAVLIASRRPAEPGPIPGGEGQFLLAHPDLVLEPSDGGILTFEEPGVVLLSIVWPPQTVGQTWHLQLLVKSDQCPAGVVVSPLLTITVGNR